MGPTGQRHKTERGRGQARRAARGGAGARPRRRRRPTASRAAAGPLARAPSPAVAVRRGGGAEAAAAVRLHDGGGARAGEAAARLGPAAWAQATAGRRGISTSGLGRRRCACKVGGGRREHGPRRTAAAHSSAGSGTVENARGNLANAKERGEHEHQWLT